MMNNLNVQDSTISNLEKDLSSLASTCIESVHAVKYLNVLCRHFSRKVKAEWDDTQGLVYFDVGVTRMRVEIKTSKLHIDCRAKNDDLVNKQKAIINHHFALFARRESIELIWS